MQAELRLGATDWENPDLVRFLEAMEAWLRSVTKTGATPSWRLIELLLAAGKDYE
jgi:hypothetical protein